MVQVDNFLKIYWNLEYEEGMSDKRAMEIVLSIKIWSVLSNSLFLGITREENAECQTSPYPICSHFPPITPSNAIWYLLQKLIMYGVGIFVNTYLIKKLFHFLATVAPVVNLPVKCQIQKKPQKKETEPGPSNQPRQQIPTVSYSVAQGNAKIFMAENSDESSEEVKTFNNIIVVAEHHKDEDPGSSSKEKNEINVIKSQKIPPRENESLSRGDSSVQRQNSNPNMFYRVQAPSCVIPPPLANGFEKTKKVLKVSLQFTAIMFIFVPLDILQLYLYFTGESCEDNINTVRYVTSIFMALACLLYLGIVIRKLAKVSN